MSHVTLRPFGAGQRLRPGTGCSVSEASPRFKHMFDVEPAATWGIAKDKAQSPRESISI